MTDTRPRCEAVYTGWRRPAQCMYVLDHSEDKHMAVGTFDGGVTKHVEWDDDRYVKVSTYERTIDGRPVLVETEETLALLGFGDSPLWSERTAESNMLKGDGNSSDPVEFIGDIREPGP